MFESHSPFERNPAPSPGRDQPCDQGRALASLDGFDLGERFYSWRGAKGASYVCSVFGAAEDAVVAGFSGCAVIGVARHGSARRPVCLLSSQQFAQPRGRALRRVARELGVTEWHVHFAAQDTALRDLAASLLPVN